jgi:hypothetical protein
MMDDLETVNRELHRICRTGMCGCQSGNPLCLNPLAIVPGIPDPLLQARDAYFRTTGDAPLVFELDVEP